MASYRIDQINEQVREVMTAIFRTVKDPRISKAFISVTGADVAKDLSVAKIYYSVLVGKEDDVAEGLKSAGGYIRSELAKGLNLRITPKLTFIKDDSTERAMHIASLLKEIDDGNNA
ncbi:MAG: 30S ribosome-binding factor RbfA [Eubacteriales bacterium]|nr:30S ribosome-binding factor RbfA [Eubacteriales bacterium]